MINTSNKTKEIKVKGLFLACRPKQWIKNLIVFLSPIFVFSFEPYIWLNSFKAFISFSLVASAIYLINDSIDINKDRKHPIKKNRSIASGLVSVNLAITLSIILLFTSLIIGFQLNNSFFYILITYFITQILYCFF